MWSDMWLDITVGLIVLGVIWVAVDYYRFYQNREKPFLYHPPQHVPVLQSEQDQQADEEIIRNAVEYLNATDMVTVKPMPVAATVQMAKRTAEFRDRIAAEAKQRDEDAATAAKKRRTHAKTRETIRTKKRKAD